MVEPFRTLRVDGPGEGRARLERLSLDDLTPGDVVVRVEYSDINYKDALAVSGRGKIIRNFPLVAGIDLAGEVVSSTDPAYTAGDKVLVMGCGLSETHDGGYAEYARVRGEWIVPLPAGMDTREAMILGTAGFTAAFAVHRLEQNRQRPELGEILVTGATGGVGSIAVMMLAGRGYDVVALTGKAEATDYLKSLGAKRVVLRGELDMGTRPLETALWAGAVDNLGGDVLGWLTRTVATWGNIASIGLASASHLDTTVMPFILRGVSLIGINAGLNPREERLEIWQRMGADLKPQHLERIVTRCVGLENIIPVCAGYLEGSVTGRTLVNIGG
ncbi:YhdH/YhfP family quinone oxidoreductase [Haliea sp. E17]|uniref:YhdH/YhfP family quinone oxidoreductase n=1 Tax=Haliea sp. E17 TaxID=3401576 RepID=UPI003AABACF0